MGSFFNNTTILKALEDLCGVMLLSQSIQSVVYTRMVVLNFEISCNFVLRWNPLGVGCWLAILLGGHLQNLDVFWGSFSEKGALFGESFYEKWYKEIFSCYISKEIDLRYNINFSES